MRGTRWHAEMTVMAREMKEELDMVRRRERRKLELDDEANLDHWKTPQNE